MQAGLGASPLCRWGRRRAGAVGAGLKSLPWQVPRGLQEEGAAPLGGGHQAHRGRTHRNGGWVRAERAT